MSRSLPPYPEYKGTDFSWIDRIPKHWEMKRAKYLYNEVDERSETGEEQLCSVSHKTGVTPRKANVTMFMAESTVGYKICRPDDLVINTLWAWMAAMGVARQVGVVSPAYGVYRPLPDSELVPEYAESLLRIEEYKVEYMARSTGVNASRLRLYPEDFLRIPVLLPPREEQLAIVNYLAVVDRKVRHFIRNRRRLIEVLNEQKEAIINRAVTRGLAPNAPLKASGIDLIGDIPKHWKACALRSLGRFTKGGGGSKEDDKDRGVPCIRYGHLYMYFNYVIEEPKAFISEDRAEDYGRTRYGDILFTASGEDMAEIGKSAANLIEEEVCCGGDLIILRPSTDIDPRFMGYATQSWYTACQKSRLGRGTTVKHVYETQLKNVRIAVPPKDEQSTIASYIEKSLLHHNALISKARAEIDLIREYRTRLIADVVTGMVNVGQQSTAAPAKRQQKKPTNVHFQRSVFAAEIVYRLHAEPTLGHVKFEKMIFLCERLCGVDTGSTYHRQAAGPYDNRALRSIDSQMKKQKWYEAKKGEKGYRYVPLEKAGGHKTYFDRYFGEVTKQFDAVINTFRTARTEQCEIVATLYSAWEDLLADGSVTDDDIIEQVLNHWHESKRKIAEERWRKALVWMKEKGLTPKMGVVIGQD